MFGIRFGPVVEIEHHRDFLPIDVNRDRFEIRFVDVVMMAVLVDTALLLLKPVLRENIQTAVY